MGLSIQETGCSEEPSAQGYSLILKEKYMRATGTTIRRMALGSILTATVHDTRETGTKICSRAEELKVGLMVQNLLVSTLKAVKMVSENTTGQMEPVTRVNGKRMK